MNRSAPNVSLDTLHIPTKLQLQLLVNVRLFGILIGCAPQVEVPQIFGTQKEFPFELFIYASHERMQATTLLMQKFDSQQIKQFINLFVELLNLICLETSDDARDKVIQINLAMLLIEVIKQFTIYRPVEYTESFYKYKVNEDAAFYKHAVADVGPEKAEQCRLALNSHVIKQLPRIASALYGLMRSILELE